MAGRYVVRVTHATQGAGDDPRAPSPEAAGARAGTRGSAALVGLRQPIVVILLLIGLFSAISGKPLDGVLMLIVATFLAADCARGQGRPAALASAVPPRSPAGRRRPLRIGMWLVCGALYAVVTGSFSRYSWPATAAVVGLGCVIVAIGWHGPVRVRQVPAALPLPGAALWGMLLVAGGLWELISLLEQPSLTTTSAAHPTISALTDPLLASGPGRSVALAAWLAIGWLLVER